jgi:hypothetical protein
MHYQIPQETVHLFFVPDVVAKASSLPASKSCPRQLPGDGLYTIKSRKKGEFICQFPGYWMEENVYGKQVAIDNHYAFGIPKGSDWGTMKNLIYVTHNCQANFINAAVIGEEVKCIHARTHNMELGKNQIPSCSHFDSLSWVQVMGELNVRFEFGNGVRPKKPVKVLASECLIKVFATKPIVAGSELLCSYGPSFWPGAVQ